MSSKKPPLSGVKASSPTFGNARELKQEINNNSFDLSAIPTADSESDDLAVISSTLHPGTNSERDDSSQQINKIQPNLELAKILPISSPMGYSNPANSHYLDANQQEAVLSGRIRQKLAETPLKSNVDATYSNLPIPPPINLNNYNLSSYSPAQPLNTLSSNANLPHHSVTPSLHISSTHSTTSNAVTSPSSSHQSNNTSIANIMLSSSRQLREQLQPTVGSPMGQSVGSPVNQATNSNSEYLQNMKLIFDTTKKNLSLTEQEIKEFNTTNDLVTLQLK
jgi:hypothetical protein